MSDVLWTTPVPTGLTLDDGTTNALAAGRRVVTAAPVTGTTYILTGPPRNSGLLYLGLRLGYQSAGGIPQAGFSELSLTNVGGSDIFINSTLQYSPTISGSLRNRVGLAVDFTRGFAWLGEENFDVNVLRWYGAGYSSLPTNVDLAVNTTPFWTFTPGTLLTPSIRIGGSSVSSSYSATIHGGEITSGGSNNIGTMPQFNAPGTGFVPWAQGSVLVPKFWTQFQSAVET